jgi:group I intron endonuclease
MKCGIYIIKNILNNKVYVGQSVNTLKRMYKHKSNLRKNCHHNKHLQDAYNKYGEESFEFIHVYDCDISQLNEMEDYYIKYYDSRDFKSGYNMTDAGCGTRGIICSEERRKQISESGKGRIAWNKGLHYKSAKKLSTEMISEIITLYLSGMDAVSIGKIYNVSKSTIYNNISERKKIRRI